MIRIDRTGAVGVVVAITITIAAAACGQADAGTTPAKAPEPPGITVVGVDLSTSRSASKLRDDRALLDGIVRQLGHGERFALLEVHRDGAEDGARKWIGEMPAAKGAPPDKGDARRLDEQREAAGAVVQAFFTDSSIVGQVNRTDLLATINQAAELIAESGRTRARLVLLSDMLNATPELSLEGGAVPGARWVEERKKAGLVPKLDGVCVVAIGGETGTEHGVAVKKLWAAYFAAAGAELTYRHTASDAERVGCG